MVGQTYRTYEFPDDQLFSLMATDNLSVFIFVLMKTDDLGEGKRHRSKVLLTRGVNMPQTHDLKNI